MRVHDWFSDYWITTLFQLQIMYCRMRCKDDHKWRVRKNLEVDIHETAEVRLPDLTPGWRSRFRGGPMSSEIRRLRSSSWDTLVLDHYKVHRVPNNIHLVLKTFYNVKEKGKCKLQRDKFLSVSNTGLAGWNPARDMDVLPFSSVFSYDGHILMGDGVVFHPRCSHCGLNKDRSVGNIYARGNQGWNRFVAPIFNKTNNYVTTQSRVLLEKVTLYQLV
jgi:hypothetical protein